MWGCGGSGQEPGDGVDTTRPTGGAGGNRRSGGSSGAASGGGGTSPARAGGSSGTAGAPGSGGSSGGGMDAAPGEIGGGTGPDEGDAAGDSAPSSDDAGGGGPMLGFYEAEAVMPAGPNQLLAPAVVGGCGATNPICGAPTTIKPESLCCSQGKEVRQLLRGRGGLQFNKITAPADGMYDVTWWYHCGKNDNFGDPNCGGEPNHPKAGCRPHLFTVNGMQLPKVHEFHCFPGPWGEIHAVTTPLPLKAGGDNSIKVVATTGRDAADLDAIAIYPSGMGVRPVAFAH